MPLSAPTLMMKLWRGELAASFEEEGRLTRRRRPYEAAPPAALSDEELARRLHEELNG